MQTSNFNNIISAMSPNDEVIHIYAEGRGYDTGDGGRYKFTVVGDLLHLTEKRKPENKIFLEIDTVYFVEIQPKKV